MNNPIIKNSLTKSLFMNTSFMKTSFARLSASNLSVPLWSTSRFYSRLLPAVILSLSALSGCQKAPEPEIVESDTQNVPVTTTVNQDINAEEINQQNIDEMAAETEREANLENLENNIGAAGVTPNAETMTPSPEQAIKGLQVTDVRYRSAAGETLSVVFETSATGVLNAIVTLPSNTKMTLSAPEGQGNNPTYRSADGNIELVSHGGGSAIDLMQNNNITSFEAISAEAEVITQP